jgi:uncharacterized damage-inducible protein DinB
MVFVAEAFFFHRAQIHVNFRDAGVVSGIVLIAAKG